MKAEWLQKFLILLICLALDHFRFGTSRVAASSKPSASECLPETLAENLKIDVCDPSDNVARIKTIYCNYKRPKLPFRAEN